MESIKMPMLLAVMVLGAWSCTCHGHAGERLEYHDYAQALEKCLLFFEGQRSGKLPPNQRMTWRKDSGLSDGHQIGVDLTGGYYDAGDNVKFGFPMAYSTTLLAWSIIEFGGSMGSQQYHGLEAVRWATDYFLKATAQPDRIYVQVGDPYADHNCWERPEDMDTPRSVYWIDPSNPGSEVAGETAAALAASSIVFQSSDPRYAQELLQRSKYVFAFADKYRGSYSNSLGRWVCPFYCDFSGYDDELMWAAIWLYKATQDRQYLNYVMSNTNNLGGVGEFGWDNKYGGIAVLLYQLEVSNFVGSPGRSFYSSAQEFACSVLPESPMKSVSYSRGGLMFKPGGSNLQHPTALSFLLVVLARSIQQANRNVVCGNAAAANSFRLIQIARSQVDYILGDNPLGMSYMVGYGVKFPQRIHHRGSSLPSVGQHPQPLPCKGGTPYFLSNGPNPNVLVGALVGGPDAADAYPDSRVDFKHSEPTTYLNAPMVGLLAYFSAPA